MKFVNCVSIRAKAGCEQALEDVFEDMTASTRQEPGCITYQLHRSIDDPLHYFLYECYVDESAYRFHQSTDHFLRVVKGIIPSLLEGREINHYRLIH